MHSRARVLGEPINPIMTVLPLGILSTAVLADLGALLSGLHVFGTLARADLVPGILCAVLALCAVLIDLVTSPAGSPTRRTLAVVAIAFGSMVVSFGTIWSIRADGDGSGNTTMFVIEVLALVAGVVGAWLARGLAIGRALPERTLAWARSAQWTRGQWTRVLGSDILRARSADLSRVLAWSGASEWGPAVVRRTAHLVRPTR